MYKENTEKEKKQLQICENRGFTVIAFLVGILIFIDTGDAILFGVHIPNRILMSLIWCIGVNVQAISKYMYFRKKRYLVYFLFFTFICLGVCIRYITNSL